MAYVSCQRVISGRQVGREAGREQVVYDVMRPKALRKRDEMAGAGVEVEGGQESEAEGVPLTITPPLDKHRLDAEESEIGWKGIEPKVRARMRRGAPGFLVWNSVTFSGAWVRFSEYSQVFPSIP